MSPLRDAIGRVIRKHRLDAGYSQERFADTIHVHRTFMGTVERGETNISLENLERIAVGLGIPLSRIIAEAEEAS